MSTQRTFRFFLYINIACILLFCSPALSQGLSTEGKDFWVGYLTNWLQSSNNPVILELYISADDTTHGTIDIPQLPAFTPINFEVYPNATKKITIPTSLAMASGSNQIENKGVHVTTDNNASVYAMNKRQYSADMTVVLPTYSLGNNYFVLSHWEDGNRNNNANSDGEFLIVAITDSTEVEITPSVTTKGGNPAGVPFRVMLQKGQIYQVRAKADLTGSQIVATNQTGCQNFAVFSGNMYTQVGECNVQNGHDHLYAEMYPTNTLGKHFIVVPLENRFGGDIVKFLATQDNTTIQAGGKTYQLDAGKFVKILSANVLNVISDKPIAVGQYSRTMDCDGTLGDPFLIPISPNEQLLKKITFNAPSIATLSRYSLNIITKNSDLGSITFDGLSIGSSFLAVPGNSEYMYARLNTTGGNHTIRSNGGFIAYVYGFGHNESFGYATGASLGNLNIDFTINDQNPTTPIDSLCLGSALKFTPIADTLYNLFDYDFGDGHSIITTADTMVTHTYVSPGEYLVSLTATTGGNDCINGNEEKSLKIIRVLEPSADIFGPRSVCPNTSDVVYTIDENNPNIIDWFVNGGTMTAQTHDSIDVNWGATNRDAGIKLLATNRYGCVSDSIGLPVKINIKLDPEAPFGPDTLCADNIIDVPYRAYFTNASTYQWHSDFGAVSQGNGSNNITLNWDGYGTGKLWFDQLSITDTICDGISDTLTVFIQRDPSTDGAIRSVKDTLFIGEPTDLWLEVDTLYHFANWQLDGEVLADTIDVKERMNKTFMCEGTYTFSAIAYDTGTICSDIKAVLSKSVYVKPINVHIINVTRSVDNPGAIDINWFMENSAFFTKKLSLYRSVAGTDNWQFVADINPGQNHYTDTDVEPDQQSYEYKIETNKDCVSPVSSVPHQSVLLQAAKEDSIATLLWNDYRGWNEGIDHYEIWMSIDSGAYQLIEKTSDTQAQFQNNNGGFDFCFEIKAIEKNGLKSMSLSNTSCVAFIPKIHTYNIITPNKDAYNETFVIDNIEHYPNSELTILNRYGKTVYKVTGYQNNWQGKISGKPAPAGTYYYELQLNEPRSDIQTIKGFFSILY